MPKRRAGALGAAAVVAAAAWMPVAMADGAGDAGRDSYTVYVSLDGEEGATGTLDDPFRTVEEARDALAGRTSARDPGRVLIREGVYQATETVALTGPANSHVSYAAYPGEEVEFTGVTTLPASGFVPLAETPDDPRYSSASRVPDAVSDQVYVYDLGAEGIPTGEINKNGFNWKPQPFAPQLMTDDVVQTLAQYPNGDATLDSSALSVREAYQGARDFFSDKTADGSTMPYEEMLQLPGPVFTAVDPTVSERFGSWAAPHQPSGAEVVDNTAYETDGWLSGYFGNNYANDRVRIDSISPEGLNDEGVADGYHVRTSYPTMYASTDKWTSFVAQNVLGELDAEGEYYIDRFEGHDVLYYYPPGGTVEGREISLTSFDQPFFTLENVTGVTLKDIRMNGSTSSGVRLLDAESCTIDGVEILNVSLDAVTIGEATDTITAVAEYRTSRGGHDNRVVNSVLHDLGGGGVFLAGGDRDSLERGNNVVAHNEIYNFSKLATYTPAGYLYGVGNTFRNNHVHDAPHMAIQIMGNDMRVLHNRFENLVTNASDQGVIYAGRDFTYLNNEIAYNYFKDIGQDGNQAIYMDDGMSGMVIHHNFFDTAQHGIFYNSGHSNVATDNVFSGVEYLGHDKLYHEDGPDLPVSNGKVVIERFNDMLLVGDGTGFSNTAENVERWYEHYADQYPNISDWYVPADASGEPCAEIGTTECTMAEVWENPDSVYVPAHNVLSHSVLIDTGGFAYTDDADGLSMKTFNPDFESHSVSGDAAADFAFDPETGRFDPRTTSLNTTDGFGRSWVREWNRDFTLEGIGPR
ncbi:right-handed parallel beta-helix repeat-containing protein [Streptomyces sp. B6B3]|uniref:right-handed parallel beta-helix repeat-containing protein n=1 Tax=Streptomyces sp. B6B3 TaxID=3153570 RepID=UPI00325D8A15